MSVSAAYVEAGYNTTTAESTASNAAKLAGEPDVDQRVKELLGRSAERAVINRARIQGELLRSMGEAREKHQHSVAVRAIELLGKDIGMFVDRKEIKTSKIDEMTIEELDELAERLRSEPEGAAPSDSGEGETGKENLDVLPDKGSAP